MLQRPVRQAGHLLAETPQPLAGFAIIPAVFALQNFELDRAEYQIYRDAAAATSDEDGH